MTNFRYGGNVNANGIRQHYLRYGAEAAQGVPIVLIPGITSPAVTWAFVGERFGQKFDTYILDVRGRGLSSAGPELDYGLQSQADDAIAFAKALGLEQYQFVGHSMGARIAARAACSEPEGLVRATFVDPPVSGPGRRPYPARLAWYTDSIDQATAGMDGEAMKAFCPTWTEEQRRLRAEWLHTCDKRAIIQSFADFGIDDFHADIKRVKVPARLITAERGNVVLDDDVEVLRGMLPSLEHVRVPNAGHMIPWDNEPGFHEAFGSFLGSQL